MTSKSSPNLKTVLDPQTGARRLQDVPSREDVHQYFQDQYYKDVNSGSKAIDIKRAKEGGADADLQRRWMQHTLYADIADVLNTHSPGKDVLEIGCGLGDLLIDLKDRGFNPQGVEIAPEAANIARSRGLTVHEGAFENIDPVQVDSVLLVNVLEQLSDPEAILTRAHQCLNDDGLIFIRSGNDFNPLQLALRDGLHSSEYWVTHDHLWYFSYDSLKALMKRCGFEPVWTMSDFPMELLALLGFNFTQDPAIGKKAHENRVEFEMTVSTETRRRLYHAFAEAGMGRCAMVAGRKV